MCGIIGLAGNGIQQVDLKVFTDIMRISTLRGTDGTGIFQGRFGKYSSKSWILEKKATEVNMFFRYQKTDHGNKLLLASCLDNVFIGHTRSATMGTISDSSCHPYLVENIVGVHNGTMEDIKFFDKNKTDSELLYEEIQRVGDLKTVLESVDHDSAYALSYLDMETGELVFARNTYRPLWCCFHKDRKVMYWASEPGFIEMAASRHNLTIADTTYFAVNTIYRIKIEDIGKHSDSSFRVEKFTPREASKKKHGNTKYSANWDRVDWGTAISGPPWDDDFVPNDNGEATTTIVSVSSGVRLTKAQRKEQRRLAREDAEAKKRARAIVDKLHAKHQASLNPAVITSIVSVKSKPIIPRHKCIACNRELTLVDQYYAQKETLTSTNEVLFQCEDCTTQERALLDDASVTIN